MDTIIIHNFEQVNYGIDWNEPIPDSDDVDQVDVPAINRPVSVTEAEYHHLHI